MKINVDYQPSHYRLLVVWYQNDDETLQRIKAWEDFFFFGKPRA